MIQFLYYFGFIFVSQWVVVFKKICGKCEKLVGGCLQFQWRPPLHGAPKVAATVAAIVAPVRLLAGHIVVEAAAAATGPVKDILY